MKRIGTILVAIALVVGLAALPLGATAALAAADERTGDTSENDAAEVTPGERLGGVIGVQHAEIDGEVAERTYGVKIANAQTDEAKADVVAERLAVIEERLDAHEATLEEVTNEREAGERSEGEYRATVATVTAEKASTERAAQNVQATASELPEALLEERGIDVDAIQDLRDRASELGGPAVSEIATSIAGENIGAPLGDQMPGAPDGIHAGNSSSDGSDDGDAGATENGSVDDDR